VPAVPPVDAREFERSVEPHRRELRAHCYRMLGSWTDAEDLLQEALLKAWRGWDSFEGRASLRSWLYRIATNACLDELEKRPRRRLPPDLQPAADPAMPVAAPVLEPIWLEPAADESLDLATEPDPDRAVTARESVALAFLSALQILPPRQRAVLLLRQVLGWSANEVADLLEMSVAAVNSALQRARATLEESAPTALTPRRTTGTDESELLGRYVRAWETADPAVLVSVLHADATLAMPPVPTWFRGAPAIAAFFGASWGPAGAGRFRLIATRANGCPAFAFYERQADGTFAAFSLQVLDVRDGLVVALDTFMDPRLVARVGLPPVLAA
jgi:RNA polymerase sigma-70 factor (ECF subfamily)